MRFERSRAVCGILITLGPIGISGMLGASAFAQSYSFSKANHATGGNPIAVVVGDFNGDGRPDLAIANRADSTVSILLGKSDGTFAAKVDYPTGLDPVSVAAADFNEDGKLDLAVANHNCSAVPCGAGTVSVLMGNGDGTFQGHVDYAAGNGTIAVAAGDFDGDGKPDLAVANYGDNTVSVLLGNGNGTFANQVTYATGQVPVSVTTGDFNSDGNLDLAVANDTDSTVSILLGNGDGTFQTQKTSTTGPNPQTVVAGDFNHDGKLDLAIAMVNGISVLIGKGDGTFQARVDYATGGVDAFALTAGDFNGDGKVDLAAASYSPAGAVSVLLGNGDGTFQAHVDFVAGDFPSSLAAGDFNGDGRLDLSVANASQPTADVANPTVSVLIGNGDGTFSPRKDYATGTGPESVATGDFDRDHNLDLAVANFHVSTVSILLGNGDGTFRTHVDYPTGTQPMSVAVGDFNGDGKLDLAVADYTGNTVSILIGNGDGTFQSHVDYPTGPFPSGITVGDLNNDGKEDLATANFYGDTVSVLIGKGDGTFQSHVDYATGVSPRSLTSGDFNGDTKPDLAVANQSSNTVSVLLGNGDGTFQAHIDYTVGRSPVSVTARDFNGDTKLDLAVANMGDATVSILIGNGNGTFQNHADYSTGSVPVSVAADDLNGDGKVDVITANGFYENTASLLLGNGDGSFQFHMDYLAGANPASLVTGDFNQDGALDFAVAGAGSSTVSVFMNPAVAGLFPTALNFGNQAVGTTSGPQTITLSNPGSAPLSITSIAASGDFAQTNTCPASGATLAIGANCSISVTFTPTAAGNRTGTITLTDDAAGGQQTVGLSGVGTQSGVTLSPGSLTFPVQLVGTVSRLKAVTLTNTSSTTLTITGIVTSAQFTQQNTCHSSLGVGSSCTIKVSFAPTAKGSQTGTLSVTDSAPGSPQTVSLTGTGTVVKLSSSSLNFGSEPVGMTSAPQTVTMTNTGSTSMPIFGISLVGTNPGDFAETSTCGENLPTGASCAISVTFTPTAKGARSAQVSINDNGGGNPQKVSLSGTGT